MQPNVAARFRTFAYLTMFAALTAEASFAGILYGGGQPIENNVVGCLDTLDRFDGVVGNAKRRYSAGGVSRGVELAGALSGQIDALRRQLRVLDGAPVLELRPALEAAIASSTALDALAALRANLRACRTCNLEGGIFDSIDRVGDELGIRLAVLGELLRLALMPDLSPELPPTSVFETLPPITGANATGAGDSPNLSGAVADLLATYRQVGHASGVRLAGALELGVQELADAIDTAIVAITRESLTPQNALGIRDALADVGASLDAVEATVARVEDCCQTAPGLTAPVRTLIAHVRTQVGALGDAALDAVGADHLSPDDIDPDAIKTLVSYVLRGAIADAESALQGIGTVYRQLEVARGVESTDAVFADLRDLEAGLTASGAEPTADNLGEVTAVVERIEQKLTDLEDCCNATPGLLVPVQYHISRVRFSWQRLFEVQGLVPVALFRRGDANSDGVHDVSDPVSILFQLLIGGVERSACEKSADANDDGAVDVSDPIALLTHLFLDGAPLPEPFAGCGEDRTADDLQCETQSGCEGIIQP